MTASGSVISSGSGASEVELEAGVSTAGELAFPERVVGIMALIGRFRGFVVGRVEAIKI